MQHHSVRSPSAVFEIIARGLPYVDRRALPEAWYASLHVSERELRTLPQPARAVQVTATPSARTRLAPCVSAASQALAVRAPATSRAQVMAAAEGECNERRRAPLRLASRIAETFTRLSPPACATFDIEHAGARVRVVMRRDAGTLRLIALCNPNVRETVARALDEARFLLASRGLMVRSTHAKAVPA